MVQSKMCAKVLKVTNYESHNFKTKRNCLVFKMTNTNTHKNVFHPISLLEAPIWNIN